MLQLQALLKNLGWKTYLSAAYCTIVENGPLKANDLAVKSKIPQGRIYDVVTELVNNGWLKKAGGRPVIYDAQNPRVVLHRELERIQKDMDESLKDAEQAWEIRTERTGDVENQSWSVSGMHGIVLEIRNLLKEARKSVLVVEPSLDWMAGADLNMFSDLVGRGAKTVVVGTDGSSIELERLADRGVCTYTTDTEDLAFYIFDGETALIKMASPDNGTIIKDASFAGVFESKFEQIIKKSKPVKVPQIAG